MRHTNEKKLNYLNVYPLVKRETYEIMLNLEFHSLWIYYNVYNKHFTDLRIFIFSNS